VAGEVIKKQKRQMLDQGLALETKLKHFKRNKEI